ncbi:MAG: riboflavin synthase [Lachnospiraceae bacterium]|nr:riboflavin synthase [Lachnospiraceae bacterium]
MFTGIIEEVGIVTQITHLKDSAVLTISANKVLEGTKVGDSIAVNGICLTVTTLTNDSFTADVMHETLNRSSLTQLTSKTHVNLERAMAATGRFGGHIVLGHVDGIGTITNIRRDSIAIWFTIQTTPELMRFVVEKGSITIDGISLTVAKVGNTDFSISAIPHTVAQTVLSKRRVGSIVNLETDIIGKYVEKFLTYNHHEAPKSTITKDLLSRYGFT